MKVNKKVYLHLDTAAGPRGEPGYQVFGFEANLSGYSPVCSKDVEFDIPDDFNVVGAQVAALDRELGELHSQFNQKIRAIEEKKRNLLSLENEVQS